MTKNRLDFLVQILETAKNGVTRDMIASQAEGHEELVDHSLRLLRNLNLLIETRNSPVSLVATQKGLEFLQGYGQLTKQLSSENPQK